MSTKFITVRQIEFIRACHKMYLFSVPLHTRMTSLIKFVFQQFLYLRYSRWTLDKLLMWDICVIQDIQDGDQWRSVAISEKRLCTFSTRIQILLIKFCHKLIDLTPNKIFYIHQDFFVTIISKKSKMAANKQYKLSLQTNKAPFINTVILCMKSR